jgi:hypothetical protein
MSYPAWWVRAIYAVMGPLAGWYSGAHGFDPALPEMGAMLLAMGRGVPAHARIGAVPMIDVAPTVTALLGITPSLQSEGTAIAAIRPPVAAKTTEPGVALGAPVPVK